MVVSRVPSWVIVSHFSNILSNSAKIFTLKLKLQSNEWITCSGTQKKSGVVTAPEPISKHLLYQPQVNSQTPW